jgi:hypothetical protein
VRYPFSCFLQESRPSYRDRPAFLDWDAFVQLTSASGQMQCDQPEGRGASGSKRCLQRKTGCGECRRISAEFFLANCPDVKMDGSGDGVPCEKQWCGDQRCRSASKALRIAGDIGLSVAQPPVLAVDPALSIEVARSSIEALGGLLESTA